MKKDLTDQIVRSFLFQNNQKTPPEIIQAEGYLVGSDYQPFTTIPNASSICGLSSRAILALYISNLYVGISRSSLLISKMGIKDSVLNLFISTSSFSKSNLNVLILTLIYFISILSLYISKAYAKDSALNLFISKLM